jgi:hypothetical protein
LVDPVVWVTDGKYTSKDLSLFEDAGQLYELLLARLEFSTFGNDLDIFRERTAYFEQVRGQKSQHYYLSSVLGKGQIGHSSQYLTHWFYPYKGKFHGQMIKGLLNFMGVGQNSLVVDPYLGSGTTLVEAATIGAPSVGVEINPALVMVSQIKADSLTIDALALSKYLETIDPVSVFHFFHTAPAIRKPWFLGFDRLNVSGTELLHEAWREHLPEGFVQELPFAWRNFLLLCYLHALSDFTYLQDTPKAKSVQEFFVRDLGEYMATIVGTQKVFQACSLTPARAVAKLGSALRLPFEDETVDGIATSPPYSIALDYIKNDEHLLKYLGIDTSPLRQHMVGLKGPLSERVRLYELDMQKSLLEMHRVLKPGGGAAILLGDVVVDSSRTNFCYKILSWAPKMGFSEAEAIKRPILGGYARLRYEYIIILRK